MLYSKMTRNYITWSMLSSLSTNPTNVLKKFVFDKNNLLIVNSNSPLIRDSNNESNLWYERYADESPLPDEHILLRPLPGTPQNPEDPVDEILRLYSDM